MSATHHARAVLGALLAVAPSLVPNDAHALPAEAPCVALAPRRWPAPLDRRVSTAGVSVPLRDALDRLAAAGRFRLSYAAELLPLDRRVCARFDGVAAGDALTALLGGTTLQPVVLGADQVVLAPAHASRDTTSARVAHATAHVTAHVTALDRVVVRGSAADEAAPTSAVALGVVRGEQLAARGATTLAAALDDAVPGVWMWAPSPSTLLARYGSIRGASSFGVSAPKIYVDGVEVANPLLVTTLSAETVDRVEVIRGPQGAALYGADAISGVVNVVTRHDGAGADGARVELRSDAGMTRSDYAPLDVYTQRHALTVRTGTATRSAGLGASIGTLGDYVPNGSSREVAAHGNVRVIGARAGLTLSARMLDKSAGAAGSSASAGTLGTLGTLGGDSATAPSLRQYTLGATATLASNERWTHRAVVGVDGYRLADVAAAAALLPSPSDSALLAARGGADRLTLRTSSVARFDDDGRATTLTIAADHSRLREETTATTGDGQVARRTSTGVLAQADVTLRGALLLTGGLRLERDAGYAAWSSVAALPTLGAAFVHRVGGSTVKLRTAYGKGIRPPRVGYGSTLLGATAAALTFVPPDLGAETQSGIETGMDLRIGGAVAVHVTRFDQRASGLIQSVALATLRGGAEPAWPSRVSHVAYELQNVGEITNRGWELQSTVQAGRLALAGALSLVDSRVARTTAGYTGDLRAGDRMLEVPARTMSLSATWGVPRWSLTGTVARASNWTGYDRAALAADLATGGTSGSTSGTSLGTVPTGALLRAYWRTYEGVTRLRASATHELPHGLSLILTGDNLLNRQRGEPDDVTVVPGRTLTLGVRARM